MTDHFKNHGRTLLANGYRVVPIEPGMKRPAAGLMQWQKSRLGVADLSRYPGHGVGVLCGQGEYPVCGVDIDISHPVIGPALISWCQTHLGYGAERVGAAPRILLAYRAEREGMGKQFSVKFFDPADPLKPSGKKNVQQVEILGDGEQFVAYHVHPDTHRDYEWVDLMGGLEHTAALHLPVITAAQIGALLAEVQRLVAATAGIEVGSISRGLLGRCDSDDGLMSMSAKTGTTFPEITERMTYLKNDSDDCDYDYWINVGMALHHEYAGTEHEQGALALWRAWGAQSPKDDPSQYAYKWKSFGNSSGSPLTLVWLLNKCNEAKSLAAFDARDEWMRQVKDAPDERTLRLKVCAQISKDDRLDAMARQALAPALHAAFKLFGTTYPIKTCKDLLASSAPRAQELDKPTHQRYALGIIADLKEQAGGYDPVGAEGEIYLVQASGAWAPLSTSLAVRVAEKYDGQEKCERRSDYTGVACQVEELAATPEFFADVSVGLPSPEGFHSVGPSGTIDVEPLTPAHRQRHIHSIGPKAGPMPLFEGYLDDTFASDIESDRAQQIDRLQEIFGAVALGIMARHEKAVLFYGPGRSGKGTALKLLEELVPATSRAGVSPFRWDHDYFLAALAGMRVNSVGELPDDQPIPAAYFKSVLGRDLLSGRQPSHRVFTFRNEAAHIFSSNSYPNTRDHSSAFYTRWLIVSFPNSRIDRAEIDTGLAARIVAQEMPAILAWALAGAQRLLQRGHFEETRAHRHHMSAWQRRTDSVMEFLHDPDVCELAPGITEVRTKRTTLYQVYKDWCGTAGRKAIGKQKFNEALDSPVSASFGISVKRDTVLREVVHGVRLSGVYDGYDGF